MKIEYRPSARRLSYGFWHCPHCRNEFFAGGSALHGSGCPIAGYDGCTYVINDAVIAEIKADAARNGSDHCGALSPISLDDLRAQHPLLVS